MTVQRLAGAGLWCLLVIGVSFPAVHADDAGQDATTVASEAPLFRVFLKDGTTLVSYGELARVENRVVFSMPVSAAMDNPQLHLVDIASDRVDWQRTVNYAESARAQRYLARRAETDYAALTSDIAQALNDVSLTNDPRRRLAIVERARRTLAEWPPKHYGYKQEEVQQMLGALDEAIAELRAASGGQRFDLSLVAVASPPPIATEPLMASPTPQELIEQALKAAAVTDSAAQRLSLLSVVVASLDRNADVLPPGWVERTRAAAAAAIDREMEVDRAYRKLQDGILRLAEQRARAADVRGVQQLLARTKASDEALGQARPETIDAIIAVVQEQLDAARRLRLERDRWALKLPELRQYRQSVAASFQQLMRLTPALEDIKSLAGSGPDAIGSILKVAADVTRVVQVITPPDEFREAHSLLLSATQLADAAARLRRQAALTGDMKRAWDASSAAAGALMLSARAQSELQAVLRLPQLPR